MHTDFHVNWLAKQYGLDRLAMLAGFKKSTGSYVAAGRIERDKKKERAVVLSLVAEGFLNSRSHGEVEYEVTDKALDQIKAEAWTGSSIVGSQAHPLATHLKAGVIKTILSDLAEGRAEMCIDVLTREMICTLRQQAITSDEQKAEQWVLDNLPALACELLDMSEAAAQLVSLRGAYEGHPLDELGMVVAEVMEDCDKQINRLKMRREAMMTLAMRIHQNAGGWEGFITSCRALQKLSGWANTPAPGEDVLREAAKVFGNKS